MSIKLNEIGIQIYHRPTKTFQLVAQIDFNNSTVDTYGIDEPIYGIPFDECELKKIVFMNMEDEIKKKFMIVSSKDITNEEWNKSLQWGLK